MSAPTSVPAIQDFLAAIPPFEFLEETELNQAASAVAVFFCDATPHPFIDFESPYLYLVRTGEFEIRSAKGQLLDRLAEGDCFGLPSLLTGQSSGNVLTVLDPGLVYRFDQTTFRKLRQANQPFDLYFAHAYAKRLAKSEQSYSGNLTQSVREIIARRPAMIDSQSSISDAAKIMRDRKVSSLLVEQDGELTGVITDRDLRNRVVAENESYDQPVAKFMTLDPLWIDEQQSLANALSLMVSNQIHHLPVLDEKQNIRGMVTTNDIIQSQISHPIFLLGRMRKANRIEQLVHYSQDLGNLLLQLIKSGTPVYEIGKLFTQVTDVLTQRLIELAIKTIGAPPCDFVWIAFGSQARREQAANSDQDNGIIYSDTDSDDSVKNYFLELAKRVNTGLNDCGFIFCPGDVMAMNPTWCTDESGWYQHFRHWIKVPEPKALMHASIFFDMRAIYGNTQLVERLQAEVLQLASEQTIFQALMTENALDSHIPLGFFKQFLLEKSGDHKDTFNLKKSALMPIIDIARVHSLANQITAVNTLDRFNQLIAKGVLQGDDGRSLIDAYEFIAKLRFEHQVNCWQSGVKADNLLNPMHLSRLQQKQLKDAFVVIESAQQSLKLKYTKGLM